MAGAVDDSTINIVVVIIIIIIIMRIFTTCDSQCHTATAHVSPRRWSSSSSSTIISTAPTL